MGRERSGYVDIDQLQSEVTIEQVAAYYRVSLPEMHRTGQEIRTRCFLNCSRTGETGDRALSIKADSPVKQWRCHHYGCGQGGNLVSMCDLLKPGPNCDGRPRGDRFKDIRDDLVAIARGAASSESPSRSEPNDAAQSEPPKVNLPLAESDNERARALVNLDEKFITDVSAMNRRAAAYFRERKYLSPEVCKQWRMGYLPRDAGDDRSGGTMRGKIVYPWISRDGDVLTWFGRDPDHEGKHAKWVAGGRTGREPAKFHFVRGFRRGIELFGQHRFTGEVVAEKVRECGLIVVEGPNDVIRLDTLDVPAVGLCSNTITSEQAELAAQIASEVGDGTVTLMLDCDTEGASGAKQAIVEFAKHCRVQLAWSPDMHGGKFSGRQPEGLNYDEWQELHAFLTRGHSTQDPD